MRLHKLYEEAVGGAAVEYEGANEVAVCEVKNIVTDVGSREIWLMATCYFLCAAETAITTIRIRRGSGIAGTEVGKCAIEAVAAKKNECSFQVRDVVGETAGGIYTLTMTESKAGSKPKSVESRLRAEF